MAATARPPSGLPRMSHVQVQQHVQDVADVAGGDPTTSPLRAEALPPGFDEAVAEAVDDNLLTPRPMEEMVGLGLDEENMAQAYYIEKGNDKKILFAMAIGINDNPKLHLATFDTY